MLGNNCNKIRPTTNGNKKYCRYPHFSGPSGLSTGWEARNLIQSHCGFKNISLPSFSLVGNTRKSNHKQHFHTDTLPALCCRTAEGWAKEAVEAHGHTDVQSLPDEPKALWRSFLVEKTFLIPPPGMTPEGFRSWGGCGVEGNVKTPLVLPSPVVCNLRCNRLSQLLLLHSRISAHLRHTAALSCSAWTPRPRGRVMLLAAWESHFALVSASPPCFHTLL